MKLPDRIIEELRVEPGQPAGLRARSTRSTRGDWLGGLRGAERKAVAKERLESSKADLASAQERLYASDTWAVLLIFQALDAAGKDGTIKHVMSGIDPQGCDVVAFKQPSVEELRHSFLWRCGRHLPGRGRIGIFNRSYYEEVLVVRVHPDLLARQHLPSVKGAGTRLWEERYEDINAFEQHLHRNGVRVVKFFLHLSEKEQKKRLLARLDDPAKQWKFSPGDLAEREHFHAYQLAYEEALTATSTRWAPWYVVPADRKPEMRALVAGIVTQVLEQLDLRFPTLDAEQLAALGEAREVLQDE